MSITKKRESELDILRFMATLAVVLTHVCGGPIKTLSILDVDWQILNCFRSAITWDVPVFVMISGGMFLNPQKELSLKVLYGKYIKKLVIAFTFWSAIFQVYYTVYAIYTNSFTLNWKGILSQYLIGPYPFWYLFMLVGVYATIPFLKRITTDKKLTEYFLVLFFVFQIMLCYGQDLPGIGNTVSSILNNIDFTFAIGFVGYFVLGYYLKAYDISKKMEYALYTLGLMLVPLCCYVTTKQSIMNMEYTETFSKYLMPNIIIESAAIYTFFVKRVSKINFSRKTVQLFSKLTEYGFGVYLVHALINELVGLTGWTAVTISPFVSVPLLTLIVYGVSLFVTVVIRKIPFIGKNIT